MNWSRVALLLIFSLAALLRFYQVDHLTIFDADQEFAATFASEVLTVYPLRLIGQGLSVQGLFLGPWYFYFLVPFYYFSHLHPTGGVVGSVALGLITIGCYYLVIRRVFGPKMALVVALFRTLLYAFVEADILVTPAFSADIAVLLTWYFMYQFFYSSQWYLLPLGLVFGLYSSIHPILFPLTLVFVALMIWRRHFPNWKTAGAATVLFIIPNLPLLLFEYYRRFLDLKNLVTLGSSGNGEVKDWQTLLDYLLLALTHPARLATGPLPLPLPLLLGLGLLFLALTIINLKKTFKRRGGFHRQLLTSTTVITLGYYFLLPIHAPDYYFLAVKTLVFLYVTLALGQLILIGKKPLFICLFSLIWIANMFSYTVAHQRLGLSLADKDRAFKYLAAQAVNNRITISYDVDYGQHYGLGYLTRYYQLDKLPDLALPQATYTIVIPSSRRKEPQIRFGNLGIISVVGNHGLPLQAK